ncbi:hypothetical protein HIM_04783 [Hirsutella minnesotensis 3608]|uniref:Nitrogen regulatory protein areA GATA-like domain-containing protein n=1 Tax=Hirsutella minnesotensis 3608 TaxID=1043627 RepID=A0A0F8A5U9_9HYPO|nr:hypothetical protein HIM_04783 [Hirsutella minnesotensis 3608]
MESSVPMILPKGIVINTTEVYEEVASFSTVPADKVWRYWHVYTTTNKRLKDPTARRLENFWWHVWGSDRRFLSGRALARLYEDISLGPTIAPLQGPPNRWEGPNAPLVTRQLVLAHLSQERLAQQNHMPPPAKKSSDTSVRNLSSSASRPPAPHPILKKFRGPSSSGPRPTARFVSPHESADEADKDGDFPSSGSTATTGLEMPTAASRRKPSPSANKKYVAASAVNRRRPVLARKPSPQSQASSTGAMREGASLMGTRPTSQPRPVSPIPEGASNLNGQESSEARLADTPTPGLSAKALGKRPVPPAARLSGKEGLLHARSLSSTSLAAQKAASRDNISLPRVHSFVGDSRHPTPPRASTTPSHRHTGPLSIATPPPMERAQSHGGYSRYSEGRNSAQGLFTGATASMTNVAAQGTIIDQAGSLPVSSVLGSSLEPPLFSPPPMAASVLESRLTPTQPGSSTSVPMGRTRSQLTLLLEREKARLGDKARSRS